MAALFTVRMRVGQLLSFHEAGLLIAQAKYPQKTLPDGNDEVIAALEHLDEEKYLLDAVLRGDVELLGSNLHPLLPPYSSHQLARAKITYDAFSRYVESIQGTVVEENQASTPPTVAGKKWTPEKLAELRAFRETHTMPQTAAEFGITEQRIRQLLPSEDVVKKGYSAFTHRIK